MLDTQSNEEKPLDGMSKCCLQQLTLEGVLLAVSDILDTIEPDDDPPSDGGIIIQL